MPRSYLPPNKKGQLDSFPLSHLKFTLDAPPPTDWGEASEQKVRGLVAVGCRPSGETQITSCLLPLPPIMGAPSLWKSNWMQQQQGGRDAVSLLLVTLCCCTLFSPPLPGLTQNHSPTGGCNCTPVMWMQPLLLVTPSCCTLFSPPLPGLNQPQWDAVAKPINRNTWFE